jgi:hypothetical protein
MTRPEIGSIVTMRTEFHELAGTVTARVLFFYRVHFTRSRRRGEILTAPINRRSWHLRGSLKTAGPAQHRRDRINNPRHCYRLQRSWARGDLPSAWIRRRA